MAALDWALRVSPFVLIGSPLVALRFRFALPLLGFIYHKVNVLDFHTYRERWGIYIVRWRDGGGTGSRRRSQALWRDDFFSVLFFFWLFYKVFVSALNLPYRQRPYLIGRAVQRIAQSLGGLVSGTVIATSSNYRANKTTSQHQTKRADTSHTRTATSWDVYIRTKKSQPFKTTQDHNTTRPKQDKTHHNKPTRHHTNKRELYPNKENAIAINAVLSGKTTLRPKKTFRQRIPTSYLSFVSTNNTTKQTTNKGSENDNTRIRLHFKRN